MAPHRLHVLVLSYCRVVSKTEAEKMKNSPNSRKKEIDLCFKNIGRQSLNGHFTHVRKTFWEKTLCE